MSKITGTITKESLRECLKNPSEIPKLLYPDGGERLGYTCSFLKDVNRDISNEIFSDLNTFDGFFETNGFGNGIYSIERSKTIEEDILNIQHAMFGKNYESDDRIYNRDYEDVIEKQITNDNLETFTLIDRRLIFPFFAALKMVYTTSTKKIFQNDLKFQSKLIMDYIIMWKFIFAWWIGNLSSQPMFPEFKDETSLKVRITVDIDKETTLNEYLSKGKNKRSTDNTFPPQILSEISYNDLTTDSKNLIKRVHMKHILKYFLYMDTKLYGRCCMTYPLAIYHNGYTCNFESLVNGYRGILWSYFNGLVASKKGQTDSFNRSKSRLSEIKEYGIRHIISRSFHNSLTRDAAREKDDLIEYEKRKLDTEFRDICTINDSMFMLATLSSFFNCPYTAMFALAWIILRFPFADYYCEHIVDEFMILKEDDPRIYSMFSLNLSSDLIDGYLLPTWPFANDLDRLEEAMTHSKQTVITKKIFSDKFSKIVLQHWETRGHFYVTFINQVEYSLTNSGKTIIYPRRMYILDHYGNNTIAPCIIDDEGEMKSNITYSNIHGPVVSYRSLFKGGDKSEIYIIVLFFTFLFIVIVALIIMYVYKTDKGIGLLSK